MRPHFALTALTGIPEGDGTGINPIDGRAEPGGCLDRRSSCTECGTHSPQLYTATQIQAWEDDHVGQCPSGLSWPKYLRIETELTHEHRPHRLGSDMGWRW
jgi:hypothetical protein